MPVEGGMTQEEEWSGLFSLSRRLLDILDCELAAPSDASERQRLSEISRDLRVVLETLRKINDNLREKNGAE
jgi:hypothetical protein